MQKLLIANALVFCGCMLYSSLSYSQSAEVVWAELRETDNVILRSRLQTINVETEAGTEEKLRWSDPEIAYRTQNEIATASISTTSNGKKLLVWSEDSQRKTVLMHAYKSPDNAIWSDAELLSDIGQQNLGANIVNDLGATTWVFWASDKDDLDDIYYSTSSGAGWSSPQKLNDDNAVPDYAPVASLNRQGQLTVSWKSFDFLSGSYITKTTDIETTANQKQLAAFSAGLDDAQQELGIQDIPAIDFLPNIGVGVVHFSGNKLLQSIRLDQAN